MHNSIITTIIAVRGSIVEGTIVDNYIAILIVMEIMPVEFVANENFD